MHLPVDFWIDYETLFWADSLKDGSDPFTVWFIRVASWIVLGYSGLTSISYSINAIINDWNDGPWNEIKTKSLVEVFSALFGLTTAVSYFA